MVWNIIFMWIVRATNKLFYFSQVHFNSKTFNIGHNIWNIQNFESDISPNIDKYPSYIFSSVKTIWSSIARYYKLVVGKDLSIFVLVTIRMSIFPITASRRSSNLFLIAFIWMWDITIRFKFVILISFSFDLKLFFVVTVVIETGSRIFLVLELFEVHSEEKVWATILGITLELDKYKGCSSSRILFFSIPEHLSFIQIFLMTFSKFFANWAVAE